MSAARQWEPAAPESARYEALRRVSRTIAAHRDPSELFRSLAADLHAVVHFVFLRVFLYDDERRLMRLHVSEAPDGVRLTAGDPEFAAKMEAAEQIMREDRDILRVLAK